MISHGMMPTITSPTRIDKNTKFLIDNIYSNVNLSNCKSAILYSDISDHLPVLLGLRVEQANSNIKFADSRSNSQIPRYVRKLNDPHAMTKFKNYLSDANWTSVCTGLQPDHSNLAYNQFLDAFKCGFDKFFPKIKEIKAKNFPRKEWMTFGLAKSYETKSKLYKEYLRNKSSEYKLKYTNCRNKLKAS